MVPLVQSIPRQAVPEASVNYGGSGTNWSLGCVTANGKAWAVSNIGVPTPSSSQLIQLGNLDDLTAAVAFSLTPGKYHSASWDLINQRVYVGAAIGTNGVPHRTATIYSVDPSTGVVSTVVNAGDLGNLFLTTIQSAITNDGSSIWINQFCESGSNSVVTRFRISDGAPLAHIQMPDATGAPLPNITGNGANIAMLDAATVVAAGEAFTWVAVMPLDLSTVTACVWYGGAIGNYFWRGGTMKVAAGSIWIPDGTHGILHKISADLSTETPFPTAGTLGGVGIAVDAQQRIWVLDVDWTVTVIDSSTGAIVAVHRELAPMAPVTYSPNTIFVTPGAYIALASDGTGDNGTNAIAFLIPTGDSTVPPRELALGRGAR